ncbi:MAG TPA: hypothetical protein VIK14_06955 [Ignavibacteria bacterium]
MDIPLNQFEEFIDETILKRGLSYFKKGYINQPEEISPGYFETIVKGTEDYTVHIRIKKGVITDYDCNCPYDMGPVCKHIAGMIFYLQEDELGIEQSQKEKSSKQTIKRKTVTEKVSDLLGKLSYEDLKYFISEQCLKDSAFRQTFLLGFAHLLEKESKKFYAKQVKAILNSAMDRNGFISWSGARSLNRNISELLMTARKHLDSNNLMSAIYISCAVMEEMTEALQYGDDSNGDFGINIEVALELLNDIAKSEIQENVRLYLLDYCFSAYEKKIYYDWDWHIGMLELALNLLKTKQEEEQIYKYLDGKQSSEFEDKTIKELKYELILRTKGEKEADGFLEQNLDISSFRNKVIEKSYKAKNFGKAIRLAEEGIKKDKKSAPGLMGDWYEWLMKIAIAQKKEKEIIEYAKLLFLNSFSSREEHYYIMKKNIGPEKWNDFAEQLITHFKHDKLSEINRLAFIYIQEERWNDLLEILKTESHIHYLDEYGKHLPKSYSGELTDIYAKCIKEYLENNASRAEYQIACKYIRKMKKLGAKEKVEVLINELKNKYNRRPALLDELNRI